MLNNIGYLFKAPISFAKKFIASPMSLLFYTLMSRWYFVVMSLSVIVLYWVIQGLYQAGVIQDAFSTFNSAGRQIKGVAQNCTPLIKDINMFLDCLFNTPEYTGDTITNDFEKTINNQLKKFEGDTPADRNDLFIVTPYDVLGVHGADINKEPGNQNDPYNSQEQGSNTTPTSPPGN